MWDLMENYTPPAPITCTGCDCQGPTVCECDGDRLYAAQNRIVDLEFALREALSLAAYYCPEELQRSLAGETAALRDYLDHDEDDDA